MADIWDDEFDDVADESDLVKQLRAVIKSGKAENSQLKEEVTTLRPAVRKQAVTSVLSKFNVNPKIAGLIPESVGADEESIKTWINEYGDLFGASASEDADGSGSSTKTDQGNGSSVSTEQQQTWERIQSRGQSTQETTPDADAQQIAMLTAAAKAANGNSELYFAYLKGEEQIPTT
jgi:hypothetical protein